MFKFSLLVLSLSMLFVGCELQINAKKAIENIPFGVSVSQTDDFDKTVLSSEGQDAYEHLLSVSVFSSKYVGAAAALSKSYEMFEILLVEKNADDAFKSILKSGTVAGQMYALKGLKTTDKEFFQKELSKYKNSNETVEVMDGCIIFQEKVPTVVESF